MYFLTIKRRKIVTFIAILFLLFFIIIGFKQELPGKLFYPFPYKSTVEKYAEAYNVDPILVIAVIREESHFNPWSNSHKGAVGLMQLMPATAKEIAVWLGESYAEVDLTKHEDNIRYGTRYLAALNKEFKGNTILVLAAYNAGSGRVNSWLKSSPQDFNDYLIDDIPFKETREYVQKVLNSYGKYSELYR